MADTAKREEHSAESASEKLENPLSVDPVKDEAAEIKTLRREDPDKVPMMPSLEDHEVPKMPGAILRHAREILGKSQRQVAEELNLRVNTISDIENDRLNQRSAETFTRSHMASYARLVKVDPFTVLELYRQNVEAAARAGEEAGRLIREHENRFRSRLWWIGGIAVCMLAGAAAVLLLPDPGANSDHNTSGQLQMQQAAAAPEPAVHGSLSESGTVIEDDGVLNPPLQAESTDPNTALARAQAKALSGDSDSVSELPSAGSDNALLLPAGAAPSPHPAAKLKPQPKPVSPAAALPQQTSVAPELEQLLQPNADAAASEKESVQEPESIAKQQEAKPKEEGKSELKLGALKRVSAKLHGRSGLASMNSASVQILAPAVLKVTDGRGKVIISGTYQGGQHLNISGIPPFKIAVSDSSKIKISYMGGKISVPAVKQAEFTLPAR